MTDAASAELSLGRVDANHNAWMWMHRIGKVRRPKDGRWLYLGEEETDLSRNRVSARDTIESLNAWYENYSPALIREHKPTGTTYGYATGRTRVLTPEQLRDLITPDMPQAWVNRINAQAEPVFLAEYRITDPGTRQEYERGQLLYSSPYIQIGFTDQAGNTWAVVHIDHSLTVRPVQQDQIPIAALAEAQLSHPENPPMDTSDAPAPEIELGGGEDADSAVMAFLREMHAAFDARFAALEERVTGMQAAMTPEEAAPTETPDELAELQASLADRDERIAALESDANRTKAAAIVAELALSGEERDEAVELAGTDWDKFELSIRFAPRLAENRPTDSIPVDAGARGDLPETTDHEAALALIDEARASGAELSLTEALSQVEAERQNTTER